MASDQTTSDSTTNIQTIKDTIRKFTDERNWGQFHSPKSLSMAIAAEAAELMEFFIWPDAEESHKILERKRGDVEHEVADIVAFLFLFCSRYNIDITRAFEAKMKINAERYPVDKARDTWLKYFDL